MKYLLLIITIVLFSSCSSSTSKNKQEFKLDSLLNKFAKIKSISYTNEFEYATYDTTKRKFGKNYQYFEEANDTSGWILNFNNKGFLNDKFHYHTVYNFKENKLYYYSRDGGFIITDFNSPPKLMPGTNEITSSLLSIIKFLKLTSERYPERINIKDTIIANNNYNLVSFSNPDGMPIKYKYPPMSLFTDTIYQPIKLAIDKASYLPKYYYWGFMEHKFSNFEINIKNPQKIWSKENLPTFFNKQIPRNGYDEPAVLNIGKKAPIWNAKSIDGIDYKLSDFNNKPTLFVFLAKF